MLASAQPRSTRRAVCEHLERRTLLDAGDLDRTLGGDGTVAVDFPGSPFHINDVAVQPDGKVVLAGHRGNFVIGAVARLNANGSVDTTFAAGGLMEFNPWNMAYVRGVALQADGKIVLAGINSSSDASVARLQPNGSLDSSFAAGGIQDDALGDRSEARDITIQRDGKMIVVGDRWAGIPGDNDIAIARLHPDGSPDDGFDFDGYTTIGFGDDESGFAVAVDEHGTPQTNPYYGTIVVAGGDDALYNDRDSEFVVARFLPDGRRDIRFGQDAKVTTSFRSSYAKATGVVTQPNGKVVVTGFTGPSVDEPHHFAMVRYRADGTADPSFGPIGDGTSETYFAGDDRAFGVAVGDLGGIIVAGNSGANLAVAAFTPNGRLDVRFGSGGILWTPVGAGVFHHRSWAGVANGPGRQIVVAGGQGAVARYVDVAPIVDFLSLDVTASEAGQNTAAFLVVRDERADTPLRVYLSVGGTAEAPTRLNRSPDYTGFAPADPLTGTGGYVDIAAGDTFAQVIITPVDDALAEGDETAVFSFRTHPGYEAGRTESITLTIRDNEAAPAARVTQVFVNGPGLTGGTTPNAAAFRNLAGIDSAFGYAVPAGTAQTRSVPWVGGISQVAVRFDQNVAGRLDRDDLAVRGVNISNHAVAGFSYDAVTRTGVWTLAQPVTNDKLRLFLDDAGVAGLDGEWANSSAAESYPSGEGTVGGDFNFRVNVLAGDATGESTVNALDLALVKQKLGRTATNPGTGPGMYSVFADVAGDGVSNALDLAAVKQRLGRRLPTGEPAATMLLTR